MSLTVNNQIFYSSSTNYLQLPTGTDLQKPTQSTGGMVRYNATSHNLEFFGGNIQQPVATVWRDVNYYVAPPGEVVYTSPGSFVWSPPMGVYRISIVCVGAAQKGGGGLGWINNYPVSPGDTYLINVGSPSGSTLSERSSFFISTSTVAGFGATNSTGGTYYAPSGGGGNGGNGGSDSGGGAGGYTGNGGYGGSYSGYNNRAGAIGYPGGAGAGGGGGGGGGPYVIYYSTYPNYGVLRYTGDAGAGGGVGLYGQGASGNGGAGSSNLEVAYPGTGGSNGNPGSSTRIGGSPYGGGAYNGGMYGGGGGGYAGIGGSGAVRVIWGAGRSFPYNAT